MQRPNDLPLREPAGLFILIQFPPSLIPPHHDMHHYHHHCHRPHDQDMKGDVKSVGSGSGWSSGSGGFGNPGSEGPGPRLLVFD